MRLLEMRLVHRLPVKHHITPTVSAEPLGIGIVEILYMTLQIVLPCASLLHAFLFTETAHERPALLCSSIGRCNPSFTRSGCPTIDGIHMRR
jgi:hypothetical protein